MDLNGLSSAVLNLLYAHNLAVIIVIVGIAVLFFTKPKSMLKMSAILLVIIFIFYLISLMGGMTFTGVVEKERLVHKY